MQQDQILESIASQLIGVWTLVSYTEEKKGFKDAKSLGPDPVGLLTYTPDGFVSAQLKARSCCVSISRMVPGNAGKSTWNPGAVTSPTAERTKLTSPRRWSLTFLASRLCPISSSEGNYVPSICEVIGSRCERPA
jgi:lipocalin-like protein